MKVTLIGLGCGTDATVTLGAADALKNARTVIGARRLVDSIPDSFLSDGCARRAAVAADDILTCLEQSEGDACVVMSGDSGFFSGTRRLLPLLGGYEVSVLPGISSLQALSSRLGRPWQDWALYSAHGVQCDVVRAVCGHKPAFFLTGGDIGPAELCRMLTEAGLGDLTVTVGERMTSSDERITSGTSGELAGMAFDTLSVVLAEPAPRLAPRVHGFPDDAFERADGVPMTKQEVRAAAISKLAVTPDDVCWDVGAGTGSVSIELALCSRHVWAVERSAEALALAEINRRKFGAWNLSLIEGSAPDALEGLPAPDAVFIGGSGGGMERIIDTVCSANPDARICVTAIAVETVGKAMDALVSHGYDPEITQISVSRGKKAGKLHLMMAQNPIFLITGVRR